MFFAPVDGVCWVDTDAALKTKPNDVKVRHTSLGKDGDKPRHTGAFVFHDHAKDVEVDDALEIIALEPNGDGNCSDAKVVKSLKVGKCAVEGHFGHHDIAFDAEKQFGFFTNPGDGTISVLSLKSLEVVTTFKVGGIPTAIVALGSRETDD